MSNMLHTHLVQKGLHWNKRMYSASTIDGQKKVFSSPNSLKASRTIYSQIFWTGKIHHKMNHRQLSIEICKRDFQISYRFWFSFTEMFIYDYLPNREIGRYSRMARFWAWKPLKRPSFQVSSPSRVNGLLIFCIFELFKNILGKITYYRSYINRQSQR